MSVHDSSTPGRALQPLSIASVVLSPEQLSRYREALHVPAGGNLVCKHISPLEAFDARLAGGAWTIVGLAVTPTPKDPPYPFLRLRSEDGLACQLALLLWEITFVGSPMFAVLAWHPDQRQTVNYSGLSADARTRRTQLAKLDAAVKLTVNTVQRGRPLHSGSTGGLTDEELLSQLGFQAATVRKPTVRVRQRHNTPKK